MLGAPYTWRWEDTKKVRKLQPFCENFNRKFLLILSLYVQQRTRVCVCSFQITFARQQQRSPNFINLWFKLMFTFAKNIRNNLMENTIKYCVMSDKFERTIQTFIRSDFNDMQKMLYLDVELWTL